MEHAFGTSAGLDELWVWAAVTYFLPAGGPNAALQWASIITDPGK